MRAEVIISFDSRDIPGGVEPMLRELGCGPDVAIIEDLPVDVTITLLDTDERLPRLVERLEQLGADYGRGHHDRFTEEELDNARLLFMKTYHECEVDGGGEFGTTYDLEGACPVCGAGARQTSALFLDGDDDELPKLQGHRAALTYRGEVLVDERLADEIEKLGPTGLVFHNVYALMPDNRQVKLRWKQISSDRILPPMSPRTTSVNRTQPCPACLRSGYRTGAKVPLRVVYRASDLEGAGDVNLTWEQCGPGELNADPRKISLPVPWLLVTPKVMRVMRNAGVTEFVWMPIRVVDE